MNLVDATDGINDGKGLGDDMGMIHLISIILDGYLSCIQLSANLSLYQDQ